MDAIFRVAIAIIQQARIELLRLDMEGMIKVGAICNKKLKILVFST